WDWPLVAGRAACRWAGCAAAWGACRRSSAAGRAGSAWARCPRAWGPGASCAGLDAWPVDAGLDAWPVDAGLDAWPVAAGFAACAGWAGLAWGVLPADAVAAV